ncbi:hypothetical protein LSH36_688g01104 [Paralvinella palmiformis]|uniref:MULE transposase domain-containing protein n=1 Tax=Paralvinella palmiformis TaxID=53620 RepID=A0AAD9J2E9_9ANNE|nr:hypothetical protein LSH36_688g01104 [Paralvinella palmiformis]
MSQTISYARISPLPLKLIRKPFKEMFSVHAFLRHEDSTKQVPFVSNIMSCRSKQDYIVIFHGISSPPQIRLVVLDNEEAIWRTIRTSTYMALCFLPTNHIPALFGQLKREASTESIKFLMEYMRKIWISSTDFPPPPPINLTCIRTHYLYIQ